MFIVSGWCEEKLVDETAVEKLVKSLCLTVHSNNNKQTNKHEQWTYLQILFVHSVQASVQSASVWSHGFSEVVDETAVEKLVKSPRRTVLHSGKVLKRIAVAQKSVAIWLP